MAGGSVYKRSNGWAFRVDAGFHPKTGKRRQVLRQGFATKKAAQEALAEMVAASTSGTVVTRSMMNVQDYLASWLETTAVQAPAFDAAQLRDGGRSASTPTSVGTSCRR